MRKERKREREGKRESLTERKRLRSARVREKERG